jgi:MrfA Zn-binding domain
MEHTKPVKQAELETLVASRETMGEDKPDGVFFARALPKERWDRPWMQPIERVVLVHRLREVAALVGFTRFEALAPDIEGELEMGVRRAALARETTWLPAIENKGEGVFVHVCREAVHVWMIRGDVQQRGRQLAAGFDCWQHEHQGTHRLFPGLPYVMLHSLAHLLITAVSLECGYPASSIRERIYALPNVGYGMLLYTGTADAEGTLGGLIHVGQNIHEHIRNALAMGELCSNDPVCSQHDPQSPHECRFLHGAACHGCLLIAETSCEQHNELLDRALVVPTVDNLGVQFFPWPTP